MHKNGQKESHGNEKPHVDMNSLSEKEQHNPQAQLTTKSDGHGHGGKNSEGAKSCAADDDETYTLKLRVAAIFVILMTSSLGSSNAIIPTTFLTII